MSTKEAGERNLSREAIGTSNAKMITKTAQETVKFGKDIAKYLKPKDVIALVGKLGCGKTTLVKGIAEGLRVKNANYVNSPSFVLIREHKGRINLYHLDLYRLDNISDIEELGLEEYFYSDGVTVIEWAEKAEGLLPQNHLKIEIEILDGDSRQIALNAFGKRYEDISSRYVDKNN